VSNSENQRQPGRVIPGRDRTGLETIAFASRRKKNRARAKLAKASRKKNR